MEQLVIRQYRSLDKKEVYQLHVRALKNGYREVRREKEGWIIEAVFYRKEIR